MDVKLNCPRCGEALSVDEKQGSGIVECPTCKYQINMAATLAAKQPASAVRSQPASQPPLQPLPPQLKSSFSPLRVVLMVVFAVGLFLSLLSGSTVGAIACGVFILLAAIAK